MSEKEIKQSTVEKVAERLKKNSNLTSEQARKIAREGAEKINKQRGR